MIKTKIILTTFLVFFLFLVSFVNADDCGGAVQCECGDTLIESQVMWYNLINCPENGLIIESNDITLDCNGHLIDGNNIGYNSYGIYLNYVDNFTIQNCKVKEFYYGIRLDFSSDNILSDNEFIENNMYGIYLSSNSDYNTFWNNIFVNNGLNNAWEDPSIENNNWNLSDAGNYWDDFENNPGYPNYYEIDGPGNGIDYHPNIETTDVAVVELTIFPEIPELGDYVNVTTVVQNLGPIGTNISITQGYQGPIGGGGGGSAPIYLEPEETYTVHFGFFASYAGNYNVYANVASEVFDINLSNNEMSLPFFVEEEEPSPLCGSTIYNNTILTEDILNCEGFGLIIGNNNITLDCDGHIIDSTETMSANYGIFMYNKNGVTIKNCIIQEFYEGLYLWSSFDNLFYNNSFIDNNVANAYEDGGSVNNNWNLSEIGNSWDDFESNMGYPYYYEISGPGDGIDWHPFGELPLVWINLTPTGNTTFPASGGILYYNIEGGNNEPYNINLDIWVELILPNGSVYGPVLEPINFEMLSGFSTNRDRELNIPSRAPSGIYTLKGYLGEYDELNPIIYAEDSFEFIKEGLLNVTITNPVDGSTITNSSTLLEATTNENAVCEYALARFMQYNGTSGGVEPFIPQNMSVTGRTYHQQLITGLYNTINNATQSAWYTINVDCTDYIGNSGEDSVIFYVSIPL